MGSTTKWSSLTLSVLTDWRWFEPPQTTAPVSSACWIVIRISSSTEPSLNMFRHSSELLNSVMLFHLRKKIIFRSVMLLVGQYLRRMRPRFTFKIPPSARNEVLCSILIGGELFWSQWVPYLDDIDKTPPHLVIFLYWSIDL